MKKTAIACLLLLLAGCVSRQVAAPTGERALVAPSTLDGSRTANQTVRGAFGAREMTMTCVVTVKDGTMTIVGLSTLGVRVFTVRYDGTNTTVENTLPIPPQLTPDRLIADMQLVYWPLAKLVPVLRDAGWDVSEPVSGTRRLRRGDQIIAEVHYASADPWTGRSWLVNLEHGYTLTIDSNPM